MTKPRAPGKTRTPRAAPAASPEEPADFEVTPKGSIRWRIGGTDYLLKAPMLVGDFRDMDELRIEVQNASSARMRRALAMPRTTEEEAQAQLAALAAARREDSDSYDRWFAELFKRTADAVPDDFGKLPAFAYQPEMLMNVLLRLRGPLPRGVA